MSITLITQGQGGGSASFPTDYNAQNANILAGGIKGGSQYGAFLDQWENYTTLPELPIGTIIQHGGALYEVTGSDYTILGSLTGDAEWYIKMESILSGAELQATWRSSKSGYSYNYAYNGFYHTDGSQILRDFLEYVDGNYINCRFITTPIPTYWYDQFGYNNFVGGSR